MDDSRQGISLAVEGLAPGDGQWWHPALRRALRLVMRDLAEPVSFAAVLAVAGVSKSYFCALAQQTFGMSFMRLVRRLRVRRAAELLATTSQSITEIGYTVGFRDLRQFERAFHQVYGCAPSAYRRRIREQWQREFLHRLSEAKTSDRVTKRPDFSPSQRRRNFI